MANTVLTPAAIPDQDIEVPTPADPVRAGEAAGATVGTVRLGFRRLFNKIYCLFTGRVYLGSVYVTDVAADIGKLPGTPLADGTIFAPLGQFDDMQANQAEISGVCNAGEVQVTDGELATLNGGSLVFSGVGTAADEGNPPKNTPLTNDLRPVNIPKSWALFRSIDGWLDGCGLDGGVVAIGDTESFVIEMAQPMANTTYSVQERCQNVATGARLHPKVVRSSATVFVLNFPGIDLTAVNIEIDVHVFGRQAS